MLEQVLRNIRNWFTVDGGIHPGNFTIEDGGITLPFLANGQYFRIIGSIFNDGVYQYPSANLVDEKFSGAIWALAIPPAVVDLADEIQKWQEKNADVLSSPYSSESFGGYSYSKATNSATGGVETWQSHFEQQLSAWRKIYAT